ncbi:MAG TPA: WcaF family extracellular polysaccharide biosynthesis acetyltransferase [Chthoniobacteraceae bacterium]|jgi:putative colanic acid biosynthesis acetyltransferase WcaF|nr:WcaF family extracellular polysaccharide biosynthesis acetyltransferase [Chthoniobacteraceae bacterium]
MKLEGYTIGAFDRGASRWREALWVLVKCLFFLPAFPLPSALRVAWLRAFGAGVGRGVVIRSRVNISYPWRLSLGDHVWLGEEVVILSLAQVTIESNVCISQRAFLCTGSHAFRSPSFDLITKPIIIRTGSWIAAQAFVAPGVTIGPDSMVAAGAVVTRDVAPGVVVAGRQDNETMRP